MEKKLEHYDVVIETYIKAKIKYRLYAESPEKAVQLAHKRNPDHIQYEFHNRKDIKITVYDAGMLIIRWIKNIIT